MDTRILYIDDDLALARLVQKNLGRARHDIVHMHDPEEAIAHIGDHRYDAIVLDHYLANMTGHDILKRLRNLGIETPVVYITGSNEANIAIEALKNGASDYVIKTVGEDFFPLLADAITQTVATARLRKAKEAADEETRRARERAEALLSEMNHRVANSLALVAGLLRLQSSSASNEETRQALLETQSRISAIAGMHRSLYSGDNVSSVDMKPYIAALALDIAGTVGANNEAGNIKVDADAIEFPADKAVSAGMIISELVTNALKYAYPEGVNGEIRIIFKKLDDKRLRLAVEDDGTGLTNPGSNGHSTGLGRKIVKTMADTLGGAITYPDTPRGTVAEVLIDLENALTQ